MCVNMETFSKIKNNIIKWIVKKKRNKNNSGKVDLLQLFHLLIFKLLKDRS